MHGDKRSLIVKREFWILGIHTQHLDVHMHRAKEEEGRDAIIHKEIHWTHKIPSIAEPHRLLCSSMLQRAQLSIDFPLPARILDFDIAGILPFDPITDRAQELPLIKVYLYPLSMEEAGTECSIPPVWNPVASEAVSMTSNILTIPRLFGYELLLHCYFRMS